MHALIKEALTDVHNQRPEAYRKIQAVSLTVTHTHTEVKKQTCISIMSTFQALRKAGLDFKWKGGRINPSSQVLKINWSCKVLT